ncbi:phosphotransferase [Pseudonocardia sp. TRM90224]|uniref:phosphotransferase n=1 Tax=Pseudonocardia sp. TRM90224 TaxID=2812678 RepID=UPI001E3C8BBB|nr:aminoglycoside phosphotransferase family protein [Pseudonocardia sp. TRM90224]
MKPTGRALGGEARIVTRAPLEGGYSSPEIERIELDVAGRSVTVVRKNADSAEIAAMRAIAVVPGVERPRLLAAGGNWLVMPFLDATPLTFGDPVPADVWESLARVHAHWLRNRPRGLPVVDARWWAHLCDYTLIAVRGGIARTGEEPYVEAEARLLEWRTDERIKAALAVLPRTLTHSDPHLGNVLVDDAGAVLIDWGSSRIAPAGVDLAVLSAQGNAVPTPYEELFAQLTGGADRLRAIEEPWADVHVNVQYLTFAADHLGAERVAAMVTTAAEALHRLGAALR